MNPMCFGTQHESNDMGCNVVNNDNIDESDEDSDEDSDEESDEDSDEESDYSSDDNQSIHSVALSVLSCDSVGDNNEVFGIDIENTSVTNNKVITLSDVNINADIISHEDDDTANTVDIHKIIVDSGDNAIDYKKLSVNELKRLAIERNLTTKGSKIKKSELIELLTIK